MIAMSFDDLDDKAELLYMTIQGRSSTKQLIPSRVGSPCWIQFQQ